MVHSEIVLPDGAPFWANERASLWNAAELSEKRVNSTVAREFEVAIPRELSREEGIELLRDFVEQLVRKHGFAAEFSVHKDDPNKWDGTEKAFDGYHAHVLCTTRRIKYDGMDEKTRELDGGKSGRENVEFWRERWAATANWHLEIAGRRQRIDHRSLKKQGIRREPMQHMGPIATALERRGIQTFIGNVNRRIEEAFIQGLADRQAQEFSEEKIIKLDQDIKKALAEREQAILKNIESGRFTMGMRSAMGQFLADQEIQPVIMRGVIINQEDDFPIIEIRNADKPKQ